MVHVFIVNPEKNESDFSNRLRDRLSRIPDLNYYVFTTGVAGDEKELAGTIEDIFGGEQLRIYCCGDAYSVSSVMDGIRDLNRVEIAIIPSTRIQFLEAIGSVDSFKNVEEVINGTVMRVDYIRTNHGVALNTVAFGMDAYSYAAHETLSNIRILGKVVPWLLANLYSVLVTPGVIYNLSIEGVNMTQKAIEMFISNVPVIAGRVKYSDDWNVTDGIATFVMINRFGFFSKLIFMVKAIRHKLALGKEDFKNYTDQITSLKIRHINGAPVQAALDGKLVSAVDWNIDVVRQGLKLVVPGGVNREGA